MNVRSARLIHNLPRNSALLGVTFFLSEKETSDDSYISVKQGKAYALGVPPPPPPTTTTTPNPRGRTHRFYGHYPTNTGAALPAYLPLASWPEGSEMGSCEVKGGLTLSCPSFSQPG